MRISGEEMAALGAALADVALFVAAVPDAVGAVTWASGPGETADALRELVGNWEHQRHLLGRHLDDLARGAVTAGAGYAVLEDDVNRLVAGGSW